MFLSSSMCKKLYLIFISIIVAFIAICGYTIDLGPIQEQLLLPTDEVINYFGYNGEKHTVETKDGFDLTVHRIVPRQPKNEDDSVVLVMHGFLFSSFIFVKMGPGKEYVFNISDAGYDVWLMNFRGNEYGKAKGYDNQTYDDKNYFSPHEFGVYDLPAVLDYIFRITGKSRIKFLSFSMSTAATIIFLSTFPEYNEKIERVVAMAPGGPFLRLTDEMLALKPYIFNFRYLMDYMTKMGETIRIFLSRSICANSWLDDPCTEFSRFVSSFHGRLNLDLARVIFLTTLRGPYMGIVQHGFQCIEKRSWVMRDYGETENIKRYNRSTPPEYNWRNISTPFYLVYAENDGYLKNGGKEDMFNLIPNIVSHYRILPPFEHANFVVGDGVSIDAILLKGIMDSLIKPLPED